MVGYLADKYGRKQIYGIELIIVVIATVGSALSTSGIQGVNVLTVLGLWRFTLGIGMVR
jgi:PHS family inorganic phosphate transporter-like MFS transporter